MAMLVALAAMLLLVSARIVQTARVLMLYSRRIAKIGSTRIARRAGA